MLLVIAIFEFGLFLDCNNFSLTSCEALRFVVPLSDEHLSEYVRGYARRLE